MDAATKPDSAEPRAPATPALLRVAAAIALVYGSFAAVGLVFWMVVSIYASASSSKAWLPTFDSVAALALAVLGLTAASSAVAGSWSAAVRVGVACGGSFILGLIVWARGDLNGGDFAIQIASRIVIVILGIAALCLLANYRFFVTLDAVAARRTS